MKVKQVIIIRKDLKMRRGKEIAQGAHASMAFLSERKRFIMSNKVEIPLTNEEILWFNGDFTKITLQVDSEKELLDIYSIAKGKHLTVGLIQDKGLTEFNAPTYTALAIGPHYEDKIDEITGSNGKIPLKLY
jgi:PTH2 family peptidyl-tRNA hydrolase